MKIIMMNFFNKKRISDKLITENISAFFGENIVEHLNNTFSNDKAPNYFKLAPDNYKLFISESQSKISQQRRMK